MKIFIPLTQNTVPFLSSQTERTPVRMRDFRSNAILLKNSIQSVLVDAPAMFILDRSIRVPTPLIQQIIREASPTSLVVRSMLFTNDSYVPLFNYRNMIADAEEVVVISNLKAAVDANANLPNILETLRAFDAGVVKHTTAKPATRYIKSLNNTLNEISFVPNPAAVSLDIYYWKQGSDFVSTLSNNYTSVSDSENTLAKLMNLTVKQNKTVGVATV